ncbi:thioredoxin-dependent thiol peroxidase [Candidatus Uhrbacteria bacterium]|nr:thioredoxin-dependent thiol peroxidase [Candidatus Uhrbacteria bacterium]
MIKLGLKAPAFTLPDKDGVEHSLSQYAGKWVVLFFYPRDNTPGCTIESCKFRDMQSKFEKLGAVILGVSKDSEKSHEKFADKYDLNFTLLSDPDTKMMEAYGVWQKKKMMGKEYMGIVRSSYLIDPSGKVAKVYDKVKPISHPGEVLADLQELSS